MTESKFQFKNPKISSFFIKTNDNFDKEKFTGFSISTDVDIKMIESDKEAKVSLEIKIGDETEQFPFFIAVNTYSMFKSNGSDNFEKFLNINAPALLLSNARPVIALMTSQLGFKPFYIPFMNLTEPDENKDTN